MHEHWRSSHSSKLQETPKANALLTRMSSRKTCLLSTSPAFFLNGRARVRRLRMRMARRLPWRRRPCGYPGGRQGDWLGGFRLSLSLMHDTLRWGHWGPRLQDLRRSWHRRGSPRWRAACMSPSELRARTRRRRALRPRRPLSAARKQIGPYTPEPGLCAVPCWPCAVLGGVLGTAWDEVCQRRAPAALLVNQLAHTPEPGLSVVPWAMALALPVQHSRGARCKAAGPCTPLPKPELCAVCLGAFGLSRGGP